MLFSFLTFSLSAKKEKLNGIELNPNENEWSSESAFELCHFSNAKVQDITLRPCECV